MKKVLIITNLFHASPRIPGLCKYLPKFGWEPTLLTSPLGSDPASRLGPNNEFTKNTRTIEVPYHDFVAFFKHLAGFKGDESSRAQFQSRFENKNPLTQTIKKLTLLGASLISYPDELRNWRKPAIRKGKELLSKEKFDAVLSSSSPVTSHRIAKALKENNKVSWLADLRDLWTQNHNYPYPDSRKNIEKKLEKETLGAADALTTVSDSLLEKLQSRYSSKNIQVITNGFDPETINDPPAPLTSKFTITYTGTIYHGKQDPEKLFLAIKELIKEKVVPASQLEVRFYGTPQDWLREMINYHGLSSVVKQHGRLPREEIFDRQRESQLLLFYGWEDDYEPGTLPLKMFEYLAARRPILATGGTSQEQFRSIINETKSGHHPITPPEIKEIVTNAYREYNQKGSVSYQGIPEKTEQYNYHHMARKFAEILDDLNSS